MTRNKLYTYMLFILATVAMCCTCSCTRNGGDIGVWFGTWTITEVTADGTVVPPPAGSYFSAQFQGEIVVLTLTDERHTPALRTYGNWTEDGDQMQWLFPEQDMYFMPLPGLTRVNKFAIVEKSGKRVRLQTVSESGVTYVYTLTKLV